MELRSAQAELTETDPRRLEAYERLAFVYDAEHEWDPAQEEHLKAIKTAHDLNLKDPRVADAYAGIGFCLFEKGRFHRAVEYLKNGLAQGPNPEVGRRAERELAEATARLGEDPELDDFGPPFVVTKIAIDARWTEDFIIKERLPFKEGDTITSRELERARGALYAMGLFKAVSVSTSDFEGGARVDVRVKDGWYVIPIPVIAAGAGGGRGGLVIEERNGFSQAESMNLQVLRGNGSRRTAFGGAWEGWSASLVGQKAAYTEHIYADGGYSAVEGLSNPNDRNNFGQFGAIADTYGKTVTDTIIMGGRTLGRGWSVEGGFDRSSIGYNSPSPLIPPDAGKQGNLFAAVRLGGGGGQSGAGLGAILGYGMAGLDERLKPLRRPQWNYGGEFRVIEAGRATGSRFGYGEYLARLQTSWSRGLHETWSLAAAGGHGASLPDSKLLATGRTTGLQGTYSREFRGPTAAGVSASYSRWLHASRWGVLQAGLFAEEARAWFGNVSKDKQGVGVTMFFRFWRFPLPLGVSYTYCIDDRNGLVSGAIGGRF